MTRTVSKLVLGVLILVCGFTVLLAGPVCARGLASSCKGRFVVTGPPSTGATVTFAAPDYTVNENAGSAVLTVTRVGGINGINRIYWFTEQPGSSDDAMPDIDFTQTNTHDPGSVTFGPGQTSAQISVQVTDHGMPEPTKQFSVKIYAKGVVGADDVSAVQILGNDPMPTVKDPSNPLALGASGLGYQSVPSARPPPARVADPLRGSRFYVAPVVPLTALYSQPQTNLFLEASPANMIEFRKALRPIWTQARPQRFGTWDVNASGVDETSVDVSNFLEQAGKNAPHQIPEIVTYDLCHNSCKLPGKGKPTLLRVKACGHKADTPRQVRAFESFVNLLASGISDHRVVLYLEMDGLISMQCLTHQGKQTRLQELAYAIDTLSVLPRAAIYVDAGAADAGIYQTIVGYLNKIGVRKIQGFFLNSTHADWTTNEIAYGQKISRRTHGAHFIVNTTVNGRGPQKTSDPTKDGNEVLCNPTTLGLGPRPTTRTGYWHVDAFAWLGYPGLSDGPCPATPEDPYQSATGTYMPDYAELLVRQADYKVRGTVARGAVKRSAPMPRGANFK